MALLIFTPFGYPALFAIVIRFVRCASRTPLPDPAFRRPDDGRVDDAHWAAVESDWHEFLDSWPTLDREPTDA